MNPWRALLKTAAVASSVMLVSWYVYDRAKATSPRPDQATLPSSKVKAPLFVGEAAAPLPSAAASTTLPGPKSAPVFVPSDAPGGSNDTAARTLAPTNVNVGQVNTPAAEGTVKAPKINWASVQQSPAMLPGSKSATPVISVPFGGSQTEIGRVQVSPPNATVVPHASPPSQQGAQTSTSSAILPGSKSFTPIINVDSGTLQVLSPASQPSNSMAASGPAQSAVQPKSPPAPQSKVILAPKSKMVMPAQSAPSQPPAKP